MKESTATECIAVYKAILKVKLPKSKGIKIRSEVRKEQAKVIRALFKELGIKGISVTAPVYSMAQSIDIRLPHTYNHGHVRAASGYMDDCDFCKLKSEATRHVASLILAAYPDMDNRSQPQIDWFDYKLSIS